MARFFIGMLIFYILMKDVTISTDVDILKVLAVAFAILMALLFDKLNDIHDDMKNGVNDLKRIKELLEIKKSW